MWSARARVRVQMASTTFTFYATDVPSNGCRMLMVEVKTGDAGHPPAELNLNMAVPTRDADGKAFRHCSYNRVTKLLAEFCQNMLDPGMKRIGARQMGGYGEGMKQVRAPRARMVGKGVVRFGCAIRPTGVMRPSAPRPHRRLWSLWRWG